jgi:FAD-dependent urate hydroxylase
MSIRADIAVIGAGPYGLSIGAHLKKMGLEPLVFGDPMGFWEKNMPKGMLLRSPWVASHLSDPGRSLTLECYRAATSQGFNAPVPLEQFVAYGRWFQRQSGAQVDTRFVRSVDVNGDFHLMLQDGENVKARCVVVAAGIQAFANMPPELASLPRELVSHTSVHRDLTVFANKDVVLIGGGQSALESAALLHEAGARVETLVRQPAVHWLRRVGWVHKGAVGAMLYGWPDVGPAGISQLVAHPNCWRMLPRKLQDKWSVRALRPAGARWLIPRTQKLSLHTATWIVGARECNGRVQLKLNDGTSRTVDHVLAGTGYRVDISRYPFMTQTLLSRIRRTHGLPELQPTFESSVEGLYFAGAPAAWTFGPLMRFVAGAEFAARTLCRHVRKRLSSHVAVALARDTANGDRS